MIKYHEKKRMKSFINILLLKTRFLLEKNHDRWWWKMKKILLFNFRFFFTLSKDEQLIGKLFHCVNASKTLLEKNYANKSLLWNMIEIEENIFKIIKTLIFHQLTHQIYDTINNFKSIENELDAYGSFRVSFLTKMKNKHNLSHTNCIFISLHLCWRILHLCIRYVSEWKWKLSVNLFLSLVSNCKINFIGFRLRHAHFNHANWLHQRY